MLLCNFCGDTFDEPLEMKQYHSEIDGNFYEKYSVCPNCKSTDIEEASKCECCGDYITDVEWKRRMRLFPEWCPDCEMVTVASCAENVQTIKEEGIKYKKAIEMISLWAERIVNDKL